MTRTISTRQITRAPSSVFYLPDFITPEEEQALLDKVLSAPKPKWVYLKNRRYISIPAFYANARQRALAMRAAELYPQSERLFLYKREKNRLQNWGGIVNEKGMIAEPLPPWLSDLFPRFQEYGVFEGLDATLHAPNHCLVNEYLAGQGIMPHKDGPAYLPTVATVSLSSHCVLEFFKVPEASEDGTEKSQENEQKEAEFSLLVQPRSLLVLTEDVYNKYMHGIREATSDDLRRGNIVNLVEALPEGHRVNDNNAVLERGTRISLTFRIVQKTLRANKILLRR